MKKLILIVSVSLISLLAFGCNKAIQSQGKVVTFAETTSEEVIKKATQRKDKSFAEKCKPITATENAKLYQCNGIKLLKLKGTPEEKGEAYGHLVRNGNLSKDLLNTFKSNITDFLDNIPVVGSIVGSNIQDDFMESFQNSAPQMSKEVSSYLKTANIRDPRFSLAYIAPDLGAITPALVQKGQISSLFHLMFGCSSVAKKNKETGAFVHGRNLDYNSFDIYDKNPLIVVRYPAPGTKELIRIGFTTESFPFSSVTGMNEKGITFSIHQLYSDIDTTYNTPVLALGEKVLSQARTLEEAAKMVNENRPGPLWRLILSDINTGKVIKIEASKEHFISTKVDTENTPFATTNHITKDNPLYEKNILSYLSFINSSFRLNKVNEMVQVIDPTPQAIAKILSQQEGENNGIYHDVLNPETIQTVIWQSTNSSQKVYVSESLAPSTTGSFSIFDIKDLTKSFNSTPSVNSTTLNPIASEKRKTQVAVANFFKVATDPQNQFEKTKIKITENPKVKPLLFDKTLKSTSVDLAKSLLFHKDGLYKESNKVIAATDRKGLPSFMHESFNFLQVLNDVQLGRTAQAKALAKKMKYEVGICDPLIDEIITTFLSGSFMYNNIQNTLKSDMENISFNHFTGGFQSQFYPIADLENRSCSNVNK